MSRLKVTLSLIALAAGAAGLYFTTSQSAQAQTKQGPLPDPKVLSFTLPDKIPWQKTAASDTAILQGDPSKPGIYIEMVRWHPGNMSRPHTHSTDRYITVLEGTWWLGSGPTYDPDSTYAVPKGSYVVHHANQLHYDGAKDEEALLLIVGMGPMTTVR